MTPDTLTFCAEPGHELYELPPLPGDFCWHSHELADPGNVCALINLATSVTDENTIHVDPNWRIE